VWRHVKTHAASAPHHTQRSVAKKKQGTGRFKASCTGWLRYGQQVDRETATHFPAGATCCSRPTERPRLTSLLATHVSLLKDVPTDFSAHPAPHLVRTADSFTRVKRPWREADHSPLSDEVKNECSRTSSPIHGIYRDKTTQN
jgi:hypothetical protein